MGNCHLPPGCCQMVGAPQLVLEIPLQPPESPQRRAQELGGTNFTPSEATVRDASPGRCPLLDHSLPRCWLHLNHEAGEVASAGVLDGVGSEGRALLHLISAGSTLLRVSVRSPVRNTWDVKRMDWVPWRRLSRGGFLSFLCAGLLCASPGCPTSCGGLAPGHGRTAAALRCRDLPAMTIQGSAWLG